MISRQSPLWKTLLLSASVTLLAAGGCHKKTNALPPPASLPPESTVAPTASITADPMAIDQGQSVVLNWRSSGATSVSIDGIGNVAVSGTQTVSPASSTNFHLVAKGDGGTTEANVRVTVRVPTVPSTGTSGTADDEMGSDAAFHAAVKDVFFGYDSYDISPEAETAVTAASKYLAAHPAVKLLIAGYCDDRGSAEYNITLGENRANAAKQALVAAGVQPARLRVVSYGKERQFCSEENESCWQQNRRAQFNLDR
ncbi:MAG TPA: OmpA family protein [Acidobacteriaceae bacterium]|jgi:peptidoglycan-associated lipoprotein|nr:OmpA family protein [Acidobacteriaceae bacterium]